MFELLSIRVLRFICHITMWIPCFPIQDDCQGFRVAFNIATMEESNIDDDIIIVREI